VKAQDRRPTSPEPAPLTRASGEADDGSTAAFELHCLRQLWAFGNQFREGRDVAKVTRAALRAGMELLGAREGCVATLVPGQQHVEVILAVPPSTSWDAETLTSFLRGGKHPIPTDVALGRLRRRERMWGVLAVRSAGGRFTWDHREALSSLAAAANEVLARIDQERIREVRARVDCKILEQLRPKDLCYQVLHGLHSLTHYDHSASLLIYDAAGTLEIVAETITWKKGKSDKIGRKLPCPPSLVEMLRPGVVYGFDRAGTGWKAWTDADAVSLAQLLDAHAPKAELGDAPLDGSLLCAPLVTRERVLGLLTVAAKYPGFFGPYEADLVGQLLPHASIALQNSQRTESLELNLLQAERKHAMADLARSVAHDVNNALGAVLPLVQQMRADLETPGKDVTSFAEDLRQIESSIQTSRRIFGGMLNFARGRAQETGGANIRQAVDNTRAILKEGFRLRGIDVLVDMEAGLPVLRASQADLEQLFLNLLTNSRDAMPHGGRLEITARRSEQTIQLVVADTGAGIPAENLPKVLEPFFSTKPEGNGLGLSICRSIVWQMQGKMDISSATGEGTRVTVSLPLPS
jgi:signal transduction histidine kinase